VRAAAGGNVGGGHREAGRPHGLRHSFAVEPERAGTPVTVMSKLLERSSVAVTSRHLDHLTNGQAVAALQEIELPRLAS
jgi:site-specific recombinase XerD